ncbi:MAG: thioesterase family protein [Ferruginibacter sp.]
MKKIIVEYPGNTLFTASIPVRITDLNYGKHVGNDAVISLLHEARMQWLGSGGFKDELNVGGAGLIMAGLMVEYKQEIFYGDILTIDMAIGEQRPVAFNLYYEARVNRKDEDILVTRAVTAMVTYNYSQKKAVPVPVDLKKLIALTPNAFPRQKG